MLKKLILLVVAIVIVLSVIVMVRLGFDYEDGKVYSGAKIITNVKDPIEAMNSRELWYDATGPFIIIDKTNSIIGYYNGIQPLMHEKEFPMYRDLEDGFYDAYYNPETKYFYIVNEEDPSIVEYDWCLQNDIVLDIFIDKDAPEKFPVLIYSNWFLKAEDDVD